MKIVITMKDPDGVWESVDAAVHAEIQRRGITDPDEAEALGPIFRKRIMAAVARWFSYNEYVSVELDTEADTCVVVRP